MERPPDEDGRAFVRAVLIREEHPRMLRQVDDGEIAVVVGVGKVKRKTARRLEPLDARHVAVARQKADAGVAALVPEPWEVRVGQLRLKRHREVGDDDEGLRERHVVDERNVRQVDSRLGRGAPVAVDRDVANGWNGS